MSDMKQTSNAIKFLMAQYRAIFKSAYFKGLATAVVVTAGLAVGQAQAASDPLDADALNGSTFETIIILGAENVPSGFYNDISLATDDVTNNTVKVINVYDINEFTPDTKIDTNVTTNNATWNFNQGTTTPIVIGKTAEGNLSTLGVTIGTNGDASKSGVLNVGSSAAGTLSVTGTLAINSGYLTVGAADKTGNVTAGTIALNGASATSDATITLNGTAATNAVLEGQLTSTGAGGTIDFSAGSGTLKTYGENVKASLKIASTSTANTAVLSIQDDSATEVNEGRLELTAGTFTLSGSNSATKDAVLDIQAGTLSIGNNVTITASSTDTYGTALVQLNAQDDAVTTSPATAADAVLEIGADKLKDLLTPKAGSGAGIDITKGTLYLTDKVDLATLGTFNDTTSGAGIISATGDLGDAVIAGKTLEISCALTGANKIVVKADTLEITEQDDTTNDLGVGRTIASSYDLTLNKNPTDADTPADSAYTIGNDMGWLASTQEINSPYYEANNNDPQRITVAGKGTIGHDLIVTAETASSDKRHN